ncbi:hypothetical protein FJ251_07215 [bacterium]|nr:hypothetical protein [bacterium]
MRRWHGLILLALAALILGATAGSKMKDWGEDHMRVDGVRLEHSRLVELEGAPGGEFELEVGLGDIEVRGVSGDRARLRLKIPEAEPNDITVKLEDGRLRLASASDNPGAIGDAWLELPAGCALELTTGYGDIDIIGMKGGRRIIAETGLGEVTLEDVGGIHEIEVSTGKGDIRVGPLAAIELAALKTGMGDIQVRDAEVEELEVGTGMGGIDFLDCRFGLVSGGTGLGKVRFKHTEYERSDVGSGWGGVQGD